MIKKIFYLLLFAILTLLIDQSIKYIFLKGYTYENSCITLKLVYNDGVAFSMLSWLGDKLKYFQASALLLVVWFVSYDREFFRKYFVLIGILLGAGVSNLADRFIHGSVVDFFYWHCFFDFAIFNFADMMIDVSVGIIILFMIFENKKRKSKI